MSICLYFFHMLFPKTESELSASDKSRESKQSDKNANKKGLYEPLNKPQKKYFHQNAARRYPLYHGRS